MKNAPIHDRLSDAALPSQPTSAQERIFSIDVLRGFALLGILVANIDDFATPEAMFDIPLGLPLPAFSGPHSHLNLMILTFKWMFIEGKMRSLFAMLFGAGVVLMAERGSRRGTQEQTADIFLRRNMWLCLLGVLHACLVWHHDILFCYGLTALLFLYPCRKLKPKTLILSGSLISLVFATFGMFGLLGATSDFSLSKDSARIEAIERKGGVLSPDQQDIQKAWKARVDSQTVTPQSIDAAMADANQPYLASVLERVQFLYTGAPAATVELFLVIDALGTMLIGIGLFKNGFLTGEKPNATYVWTAIVGFGIAEPLYLIGVWKSYQSGFYFLTIEKWLFLPYYLTREAGALAILSVLLLIIKGQVMYRIQALVAAVGKTALSNYIFTSLLCQFLFVWGPWDLYGKLEYYQIHYVVIAVWAVNLTISQVWQRRFLFGPIEWLWRSLTYARPQPFQRSE